MPLTLALSPRAGRGDEAAHRDLRAAADPAKVEVLLRFFKTGPGDYGEGDQFLGVTVPRLRKLVRAHHDLALGDLTRMLDSPWHEERLLALLILVRQYERGGDRDAIYDLYLAKTDRINNWDLVDGSAPHIVGAHLEDRDRSILDTLARSQSLWERRIAMIATQRFIRRGDFKDALRVAALLLRDEHDLIHKASGWMLREIGDRDRAVEEAFLRKHAAKMPRTMLRYAVEKFPEELRRAYVNAPRASRIE